jgi:hypothetical protein
MTQTAEQTRQNHDDAVRQIGRLIDEIARLSDGGISSADYFGAFLKQTIAGLSARAGAVWMRTNETTLRLEQQVNLDQVGIDETEAVRRNHEILLRQVLEDGRPWHRPFSNGKPASPGVAGNPTNYELLIAPITFDNAVVGLIEVWLNPGTQGAWALQLLVRLAELASLYVHKLRLREMIQQQQLWTELESFARQAHGSLDPTQVAYLVANEGRRLTGCDRLSVGLREGKRVRVEAVSGADLVEARSKLIQLMRQLLEHVLVWGEKLVYDGTPDASLPPDVLAALDDYLAVSPTKFLVALPLRDDREKDDRSVLLLECFEADAAPAQLTSRLEAISRHAASALYNASAYRRIPLPWLWRPIAKLQEGVGGKARATSISVALGVTLLVAILVLVPYPLKTDAKGQLLPEVRRWVYSPVEGEVVRFEEGVQPGSLVAEGQPLVLLYDVQLEIKFAQLTSEIASAQQAVESLAHEETAATTEADRLRLSTEKKQREFLRNRKILERTALRERTGSEEGRPGYFWIKSPLAGTVLNSDFRENLTNRNVKPSEPLLRIGDKRKPWEIELKVPQKHIGHLVEAFDPGNLDDELDVDLKLLSSPTRTYKGKLSRRRIGSQAISNRDDVGSPEPVIVASVRIDGPGIAEPDRIPPDLLVSGTEVHTRARCGNHALGYCLFHGLWEFFKEKVWFW